MAGNWGSFILPVMVVGIVGFGLIKKVKVFDCFMYGARKGLHTVYDLMPSITGLVVAVTLRRYGYPVRNSFADNRFFCCTEGDYPYGTA